MHFAAVLNWVWLVLGIGTLALTFLDLRRGKHLRGRTSHLRMVGALALAGALFPYISASDDLARIEAGSAQCEHQDGRDTTNSRSLVSLYHAMDTSVATGVVGIVCVLVFWAFLPVTDVRAADQTSPQRQGRSPPAFDLA